MPDVPEDYYYSSLEAEEIEDRLLHMVTYHKTMHLSDEEKALFRTNIGAGTANTGLIILGYFDTLEDLRESLTVLPKAGDAYGVGTSAPYDIYIYDGYHGVWINNGPLNPGGTTFDDNTVSGTKGWTSNKIKSELTTLDGNKQAKITASGILKGNGSGSVSAAVAGTDYLTRATNYSPWSVHDGVTSYSIVADDAGKTIRVNYNCTITLSQAVSQAMPVGTEIGLVCVATNADAHILLNIPDGRTYGRANGFTSVKLNGICSMNAIKKAWGNTWFVTGSDVEVVS